MVHSLGAPLLNSALFCKFSYSIVLLCRKCSIFFCCFSTLNPPKALSFFAPGPNRMVSLVLSYVLHFCIKMDCFLCLYVVRKSQRFWLLQNGWLSQFWLSHWIISSSLHCLIFCPCLCAVTHMKRGSNVCLYVFGRIPLEVVTRLLKFWEGSLKVLNKWLHFGVPWFKNQEFSHSYH